MTKIQPSLKAAAEAKDANGNKVTRVRKALPTFEGDPRDLVVVPGFNSRPIDEDHVKYFMSLRKAGVDTGYRTVQMIDGQQAIRDGHHRHEADMRLIAEGHHIESVKLLEFKGDEKAAIFLMLATQSGLKYTPMQLGVQYVKLVNTHGMSYAQVAAERGCSAQHVKDCIRLTEQPTEVKALIESGQVKSSTMLKAVKKSGAAEAVKQVKEAAKTSGKGKATDKTIKGTVSAVVERTKQARDQVEAMLESPDFDGPTKDVLKKSLSVMNGYKLSFAVDPKLSAQILAAELDRHRTSEAFSVRQAVQTMIDHLAGKTPPAGDDHARSYAFMVWLQDTARDSKDPHFRAAAHWFFAVMDSKRSRKEIAPAPSVLSLEDAMRSEMESGGAVMAETLCPEHADLIVWMRGAGK